eukprot:TRINITY_DN40796_c0_g1_i1.p2 TRINITY_DN40796_c0_g1~~TRINITY_DN40796_c0_g1_i1.p2  ORF type:complete len:219 (-),score=49.71 TRINITY_DN40796_c0_g1_i1:37-693(-)
MASASTKRFILLCALSGARGGIGGEVLSVDASKPLEAEQSQSSTIVLSQGPLHPMGMGEDSAADGALVVSEIPAQAFGRDVSKVLAAPVNLHEAQPPSSLAAASLPAAPATDTDARIIGTERSEAGLRGFGIGKAYDLPAGDFGAAVSSNLHRAECLILLPIALVLTLVLRFGFQLLRERSEAKAAAKNKLLAVRFIGKAGEQQHCGRYMKVNYARCA